MLGNGDDMRWDMKFKRDATAASFRFANIGCSQLSCGIQNVVDEFIQHLNQPVGCQNDGIITVLSCLQLRHVNVNHSNKGANDIPLTKFPDTNIFPPLLTALLPLLNLIRTGAKRPMIPGWVVRRCINEGLIGLLKTLPTCLFR